MEEAVRRVAARIRAWRRADGLSLHELSQRSAVSPSTIHKIEHGQTVPTIAVVLKLATGLGRRPAELFEDAAPRRAATHVRAADRPGYVTAEGAVVQSLASRGRGDHALGVWRIVQPPGPGFSETVTRRDEGDTVVYVEDGSLCVIVDGEAFTIEAGDTLRFPASSPHAWRAEGDLPAVAIVLGRAVAGRAPASTSPLRAAERTPMRDIGTTPARRLPDRRASTSS